MPDILLSPDQLALGNNPLPPGAMKPRLSAAKLIPQSDWYSTEYLKQFVPRGKCQFNQPSCNSYATGKVWQTKYACTIGKAGFVRPVSYSALHQEITGGNMDDGSMPLDSIRINQERGLIAASSSLPEWYSSPRNLTQFQDSRKLNRADEWEDCPSGAYIVSAVLAMQPCDFGIWWYDTDVNAPNGELVVRGRTRLGGHALVACGLVMGYHNSPSGVGILFNNHHGDSQTPSQTDERGNSIRAGIWGNDGFGIVPIERLDADVPTFGAFALRSVMVNDEDLG